MKIRRQTKRRINLSDEFIERLLYPSLNKDRSSRRKDWLTRRKHCKYLQYGFTQVKPRKMWNIRQLKIYNAGLKILDDYYISPYCYTDNHLEINSCYYFNKRAFIFTLNHMNSVYDKQHIKNNQ